MYMWKSETTCIFHQRELCDYLSVCVPMAVWQVGAIDNVLSASLTYFISPLNTVGIPTLCHDQPQSELPTCALHVFLYSRVTSKALFGLVIFLKVY